MSAKSVSRRRRGTKCECGCGQTNTGRLRKAECTACGYIIYLSRGRIAQGLPTCPCGAAIEPPCLRDRAEAPGDAGREAWSEYAGRAVEHDQRSEYAKRAARSHRVCPDCRSLRSAGDALQPDWDRPACAKCGSTARPVQRRILDLRQPVVIAPDLPF